MSTDGVFKLIANDGVFDKSTLFEDEYFDRMKKIRDERLDRIKQILPDYQDPPCVMYRCKYCKYIYSKNINNTNNLYCNKQCYDNYIMCKLLLITGANDENSILNTLPRDIIKEIEKYI
jgi:hypothetical protein